MENGRYAIWQVEMDKQNKINVPNRFMRDNNVVEHIIHTVCFARFYARSTIFQSYTGG